MRFLQALVDNSATVLSWLTALFGLLVTLDVIDMTNDQIGAVVAFVGLSIALLSTFLTVAKRQVVTRLRAPGAAVEAGPAAAEPTGRPVPVAVNDNGQTVAFATVPAA